MDQFTSAGRLIGRHSQLVDDLDESGRVVLPPGGDFDLGGPVVKVEQRPARSRFLSRQAANELASSSAGPGKPVAPDAQLESNRIVSEPASTWAAP